MSRHQVLSRYKDGLDDVGSLALPINWRMDARTARNRSISRPWHEEDLRLPLDVMSVDPERVLYWDNDPERENSLKRVSHMLAARAVPLVVKGGNTMRNVVGILGNPETASTSGYELSRIMIARRVLAQLQTEAGQRSGHYRSANLRVIFRYQPPQGEALEALVDTLRG